MGRSVSYLNNAEFVLYFPAPNGLDENGEYNEDLANLEWDCMMDNLTFEIMNKLPSYYKVEEWDNRETRIFLQNKLCNIGISEYCGLVSLSVAPINRDCQYSDSQYKENFAKQHARKIKKTLQKIIDDSGLTRLNKIGSFSNGECLYQKAE
jgi:hypothetical protein